MEVTAAGTRSDAGPRLAEGIGSAPERTASFAGTLRKKDDRLTFVSQVLWTIAVVYAVAYVVMLLTPQ